MSFIDKSAGNKTAATNGYERFWNWFQNNEKVFYRTIKERQDVNLEFFDKLAPELRKINSGIYFLAGMFDENTVELIFTAEGNVKVIAFVEEMVASAPAIQGWKFTALKPASSSENFSVSMAGYEFNQEKIFFIQNEPHGYPDEINISIVYTELNDENKKIINKGIEIFLDNYLGELNFTETIDVLNVIPRSEATSDLIPASKLKDYLIWRQKEFVDNMKEYGLIRKTTATL